MTIQIIFSVLIIVAFFALYIFIGHISSKSGTGTVDDFVLADRGIGQFVGFFMVSATWISVVFFMGGPGWFYDHGLAFACVPAFAFTFGLTWWFFGRQINKVGRENNYMTQGDFIADFYKSEGARFAVLVVGILALVPYVQSQFQALGYITNAATAGLVPIWLGSIISFVVVVIYVNTGGFRATAWTNVIQGILMFLALFIIGGLIVKVYFGGSLAMMFQRAMEVAPQNLTLPGGLGTMTVRNWGSLIILNGFLGGIWMPHLFVRAYSIKESSFFHRYPKYLLGLYMLIVPMIVIIGLGGRIILAGVPLQTTDQILPMILTDALPLPLVTLLLTGAIGASMSTIDGLTHTVGSMFVYDFVKPRREVSDKTALSYIRWVVFLVSLLGLILGLLFPGALYYLFGLANAFGGILVPSIVAALTKWKRANKWSCMVSIWGGLIAIIVFHYIIVNPLGIQAGVWSFIVAAILFLAVSFAGAPESSLQQEC